MIQLRLMCVIAMTCHFELSVGACQETPPAGPAFFEEKGKAGFAFCGKKLVLGFASRMWSL